MNHLEKYVPRRRDSSAAAIEKDATSWRSALHRQSLAGGASAIDAADSAKSAKPPSGWAKAMSNLRHDIH